MYPPLELCDTFIFQDGFSPHYGNIKEQDDCRIKYEVFPDVCLEVNALAYLGSSDK